MPITNIEDTARELIRTHGDKAAIVAAQEADAALARGDMESAYSWRRVIACIEDMTASKSETVQ